MMSVMRDGLVGGGAYISSAFSQCGVGRKELPPPLLLLLASSLSRLQPEMLYGAPWQWTLDSESRGCMAVELELSTDMTARALSLWP
ncbi:hypothetical protein NL676_008018 [Syzygium grande]|nr:hypothetical protein NL676_008018 [Syzygium grande]